MFHLRFNAQIWISTAIVMLNGTLCANGQSAPTTTTYGTVTIASPTAASLGKFGDIPVGYHTGIPDITIPIYTVQAGPLKLPVSLSYHASGLKVMEPAGWVGAGWALNAGGVITRTVQGAPDEVGGTNCAQLDGHFSQNGFSEYLYSGGVQDWPNFAAGYKDGQPDLYFFNFGGYTGKFYFRDDRTPILVPEQDLQIIPSYSGGRSIDYFTIVTPDGARYVFGNSPGVSGTTPIEITNIYSAKNGSMNAPPTSSWFLNKVVSADNQFTINLTYTAENYGYFTLSTFPIDGASLSSTAGIPCVDLCKNIMTGVRLSQISFPNGTVSFNAGPVRTDLSDNTQAIVDNVNTSATSLGSIQISDGNGFCKGYTFYYDYFSGDNTALPTAMTTGVSISTDQQRLRLDSVKETSCDGTIQLPPYKFAYFYPNNVPRRLSFAVDHWGYFNGQTANAGLLPTLYVNGSPINSNGAIRDASFPQDAYGNLVQITYPTGGTDVLAFQTETDQVQIPVNGNIPVANFALNVDGQGGTSMTSNPFTSDGNPLTVNYQTNCNNSAYFTITNTGTSQVVYSGYLNGWNGTGGPTQYTMTVGATTVPAGSTYTISASIGTNPTGGYAITVTQPGTTLETITQTSGSSRIASITKSDGISGINNVTNFGYIYAGGGSSAILYSQPTYIQVIRNDLIEQVGLFNGTGFSNLPGYSLGYPGNGGDYYVSAGSIMPMSTVQGSAMGYLYVTASQTGNGYSAYQYYASNEGFPNAGSGTVCINSIVTPATTSPPNYPPAPLPFDYKKGELSSEQHYDNSGNLLKDIYYYPQYNTAPLLSTPAFIVATRSIGGNNELLGTDYSLNTIKKTSMQTVEHDYNQGGIGGFVTKTTNVYYGSTFHNQPTRLVTSTSTGDTLATNTTYAQDFRLAACDAISDCSAGYNSACSSCQTTYNSAITACANDYTNPSTALTTCTTNAVLALWQCNTTARTSYITCRNTNYMGTGNAFAACHLNAEDSADAILDPILVLQDESSNPPIEVTQWKDLNLRHASFTQFNLSTTPAGYVYLGKMQEINLQASSPTFTPGTVSGTTVAKDSRYLDEIYFTFTNGNPQQVTGHDGVPIAYIWNYNNTQPVAKVSNATVGQIAYTSFEGNGTGNWTYTGTATADPSAITGAYSYNLAQTSGSVSMTGLTSSAIYVVSYWSKTGSSYTVTGSTGYTQGKTIALSGGTWTYFEHTVTGVSTVTVTGTGVVDELRLYPQNAQMTTYTYSPLVGMTTSCDVDNRVTYYTYDVMGRLRYIRDQDGNILKTIQYHYANQNPVSQ
jgi:YD repeat-containing protein